MASKGPLHVPMPLPQLPASAMTGRLNLKFKETVLVLRRQQTPCSTSAVANPLHRASCC